MKRSTPNIFYVTPHDFDLILKGKKVASSRLGDRSTIWPLGKKLKIVDNTNDNRILDIAITFNYLKKLKDINEIESGWIGDYSPKEHYTDFTGVYENTDEDTELSIVGFQVIN